MTPRCLFTATVALRRHTGSAPPAVRAMIFRRAGAPPKAQDSSEPDASAGLRLVAACGASAPSAPHLSGPGAPFAPAGPPMSGPFSIEEPRQPQPSEHQLGWLAGRQLSLSEPGLRSQGEPPAACGAAVSASVARTESAAARGGSRKLCPSQVFRCAACTLFAELTNGDWARAFASAYPPSGVCGASRGACEASMCRGTAHGPTPERPNQWRGGHVL